MAHMGAESRFVYATLLPTGHGKVGIGTKRSRATAASTYLVGTLHVLGIWPCAYPLRAERKAHRALWWAHLERELYDGSAPGLIAAAITEALGTPSVFSGVHVPPPARGQHTQSMRQKMRRR